MKNALFLTACLLATNACNKQADNYPSLMPTAQVLAEPTLPSHSADAVTSSQHVDAQAAARAQALRNRAEALKKPVIEPEMRERMQQNQ